jgi:ribosome-associated heat shock protein Hsp15
MPEAERVRVDRWLWSVRVYKTRTDATAACTAGHVKVGGNVVKPAQKVGVGDEVEARRGDRVFRYEVVRLVEKRVGPPVAVTCFVDHSPPPPPRDDVLAAAAPVVVAGGRPTKRDRRRLDDLRGGRD